MLSVKRINVGRLAVSLARERSATSAVVQNFAVRVALIFVTFGTGIIVARSLAPVGRGEQAALALWPALLAGLATLGIPMAVNYQSKRRPDEAAGIFFSAVLIAIVSGTVVTGAGIAAMPLLLRGYDQGFITDARWMMLFAPQFLVLFVIRAHLEAHHEYTRSILGQLFPTILTLVSLVILRSAQVLTPVTAVLCYFIPGALWTLWSIVRLWPKFVIGIRSMHAETRPLLAYGLQSYGTDVINALSSQLDLAVIVMFLDPVSLGYYSVSLTIARLLNIVQQSLVVVIFPHASALAPDRAIDLIGRGARFSLIISVTLGIALLAIVPIVLPFAYGPMFAPALKIMPLLALEAILTGYSGILVQAFLSTGRPIVVTFIQAGWLACAISLLILLVPRMSISGAAVALVSASVIRIGLVSLFYRAVLHRGLPRVWPNMADFAYVRDKVLSLSEQRNASLLTVNP